MVRPQELSGKRILYGCLDWGMGHVSRSIPLIAQLVDQGNEVIVWCSPEQERIFREFSLPVTYIHGFDNDFKFRGDGNFYFEMLRNARRFRSAVKSERKKVAALVKTAGIDVIVSDHRYGMYTPGILSVFVTHQCVLPPGSGFIAGLVHKKWRSRFSEIWIMDDINARLAGELSQPVKNSVYIGHYSRFSLASASQSETSGTVAIISGPEPYSRQFFEAIFDLARAKGGEWKIVCPEGYSSDHSTIECIHDWRKADEFIHGAELIISRCGYSTLMDLHLLKKKAILVPTKGQLEQEYFYRYFSDYKGEVSWKIVEGISEISETLI